MEGGRKKPRTKFSVTETPEETGRIFTEGGIYEIKKDKGNSGRWCDF